MESPRWKKVWKDLWANKTRTVLVALSIAVGVFAVGVIAGSFYLVRRDMQADYTSANPHTARFYSQEFDDSLLAELSDPEVTALEGRYNLWVNLLDAAGREYQINLNSIGPLAGIQVDQLDFEAGSQELADGEIYLERQAASELGLRPGDTAELLLNDGRTRALVIAGTVHDVQSNPYRFTSQTAGFVTPATMAELGGSELHNFVNLVTAGSPTDAEHVREVAERVARQMADNGVRVYNVNVNRPGQHPAQSIIDAVLVLLAALGVLTLFLSGFLVTSTIAALMGQQVRQIGVMKAVGATTFQVLALYIGLVLAFGLLALLVAVPLSALAAYGLSRWMIGMLNATPSAFTIPPFALGLQLLIGLAVPVLAAIVPVLSGARRTVREAMTSYGLNTTAAPGLLDRLVASIRGLPRPLLLSLRNTFRRKGRLALTLVTLILGGAIFIAVFSVRDSLYAEVDQTSSYFQADVNVTLNQPYLLSDLQAAVADAPGVARAEGWLVDTSNVLQEDGLNSDLVHLFAPPAGSTMVNPVMTAGRWLEPGDERAIVIDNHFTDLRPEVGVGDTITMVLDDEDVPFEVVGIYRMAGTVSAPYLYLNYETLAGLRGLEGQANALRLVTENREAAGQQAVKAAVKARLEEAGIGATLQTGSELISQHRSRTDILISLLLVMGVLIALVGGLGLMGAMGMNVLERTREIGVMRSVGAENRAIFQMVLVEGALIGLLSWFFGLLAALPITYFLDQVVGRSLMTVPLIFRFSLTGLFLWLVMVLVLAALASWLPARNAVRLTVRDVLAYE